jgi:hypothetical protein
VVKCYFTARQSRENRHVKKKRGCQIVDIVEGVIILGLSHAVKKGKLSRLNIKPKGIMQYCIP